MTLTPDLLHILQHSLGLDMYGRGNEYRNYYATGPDCDSFALCRELVAMGLMQEHPPRVEWSPYFTFVVTDAGRAAVREHSPKAPKLTRSQLRYAEWLRADSGLKFGEWLKRGVR